MVQKPKSKSLVDDLKDAISLVVAPENRKLSVAWLVCLVIVAIIGLRNGVETASFIGIADSRESIVNFDFPVNVAQIGVLPGQSVKKGELIAHVDQPDLELKIQEARASLMKLQAQQNLVNEMGNLGGARKRSSNEADPLLTEIENLKNQITTLETRQKSLYVFAPFNGVVGSVNYKVGESVKPYEPLLTVSPTTPTFIDAFVHESLQAKVAVGQTVDVLSMSDSSHTIEGRVVSMGSRIVELPVRIGRMQSTKMWGREILIEIPSENPFLLGEKVQVSRPLLKVSFPVASASEKAAKPSSQTVPSQIIVPELLKTVSSFEPSGAVYIKDLKKFLVASDDTDKNHTPLLFLLDRDGTVDRQVVKIAGLNEIRDVESLLQDETGAIYLMSSQSPNKKGELKASRDLLVRVKREGVQFSENGTVELRPMILTAVAGSKDPDIKAIAAKMTSELEIESGYLDTGHLKVGLKKPLLDDGSSVILDLGPISQIIESRAIAPEKLSVAEKIMFPIGEEKNTRISDIAKINNKLIITTVSRKPGHVGRLWSMNETTKALQKIGEYPDHSPEAVAYDADNKDLMVLFDEKEKPALFLRNSSIDFN